MPIVSHINHTRNIDFVTVACDFGSSIKCNKTYEIQYTAAKRNLKRNNNKILCYPCSIKEKLSGRNNPNTKYKTLDDNFFRVVNSEQKAYLLGFIASDGHVPERGFSIEIQKKDKKLLRDLRNIICSEVPTTYRENKICLSINSRQISRDICRHLHIVPGKKHDSVGVDRSILLGNHGRHFVRGYFDGDGSINYPSSRTRSPQCFIKSNSQSMLDALAQFSDTIPYVQKSNLIRWNGANCIDFLRTLYENAEIKLERKWELYAMWCRWAPMNHRGTSGTIEYLTWSSVASSTVAPTKTRASDSGYDLTLIKKEKSLGNDTHLYTTGIKIAPKYNVFYLLVARSSLAQQGYFLTNGMGIIDQTYTGEIKAVLTKINNDVPDLTLPSKAIQLIPMPIVHLPTQQVFSIDELDQTERGEDGFGSTGM